MAPHRIADPLSSAATGRRSRNLVSGPAIILRIFHADELASHNRCGSLYGATVTSWKVAGKERLFLSQKAALDGSKAVSAFRPVTSPHRTDS
jgi:hypothetical protein